MCHQLLAALQLPLPTELLGKQRGRQCCPITVTNAAVALHRLLENAHQLCGALLLRVQPAEEGKGGGAIRAGFWVGGVQSELGEPAAVGDVAGEPPELVERADQSQGRAAVAVAAGMLDRGPHVGALDGQQSQPMELVRSVQLRHGRRGKVGVVPGVRDAKGGFLAA